MQRISRKTNGPIVNHSISIVVRVGDDVDELT